jgi:hypothetical protein
VATFPRSQRAVPCCSRRASTCAYACVFVYMYVYRRIMLQQKSEATACPHTHTHTLSLYITCATRMHQCTSHPYFETHAMDCHSKVIIIIIIIIITHIHTRTLHMHTTDYTYIHAYMLTRTYIHLPLDTCHLAVSPKWSNALHSNPGLLSRSDPPQPAINTCQ